MHLVIAQVHDFLKTAGVLSAAEVGDVGFNRFVNEATSVIVAVIFGSSTRILQSDNPFADVVAKFTKLTLARRWETTVSGEKERTNRYRALSMLEGLLRLAADPFHTLWLCALVAAAQHEGPKNVVERWTDLCNLPPTEGVFNILVKDFPILQKACKEVENQGGKGLPGWAQEQFTEGKLHIRVQYAKTEGKPLVLKQSAEVREGLYGSLATIRFLYPCWTFAYGSFEVPEGFFFEGSPASSVDPNHCVLALKYLNPENRARLQEAGKFINAKALLRSQTSLFPWKHESYVPPVPHSDDETPGKGTTLVIKNTIDFKRHLQEFFYHANFPLEAQELKIFDSMLAVHMAIHAAAPAKDKQRAKDKQDSSSSSRSSSSSGSSSGSEDESDVDDPTANKREETYHWVPDRNRRRRRDGEEEIEEVEEDD